MDVDATDITEATFYFRAAYGGKNFDSNVIDNDITRLSINQPQIPFNSLTASAYNITGACDVSLSGSSYVVVSIQNTNINAQGDCANDNTFSVDLAASNVGEASSITIEVTYAGKTKSSQPIDNSIVPLSLNDLTLLNSSTAEAYEVTGKCDSSLSDSAGDVTVSVVETAASQTSPCSGDTFSVNFDLSAVTSDSYEEITIRAEYGGLNVQETVTNNITELAIDSDLGSLTEANKGAYTVSGKCDPSLVGNLSIVVGQPDTTAVLVPCANDKTFETQIDVSSVTYNPATITVTQGTGPGALEKSRTVDNEITIPLSPPTLRLHSPSMSPSNDSTPEFTVSGVEPLTTVQLFSDNTCSTAASNPKGVLSGQSTVTIEATALEADGTTTYYARQTNQAGQQSECSLQSVSYDYDGTEPDRPSGLSLDSNTKNPSDNAIPEIVVEGVESLARVQLFSDANCSTAASNLKDVQQGDNTVTIEANTIVPNDEITYYALQTDQAGNPSECSSESLSYTHDNTKPDAPSGLSLSNSLTDPGNNPTPEIVVEGVESLAIVELFSDNSCSTSASSQIPVSEDESTINIVANPIALDGIVNYYALQTDEAGHKSDCSNVSLSYDYDGTPPSRPSGLILHNSTTSPSDNTTPKIVIQGVEPLAKVQLFSDDTCSAGATASNLKNVRQTHITVGIVANAISNGTITYYARQTDRAGNPSECSFASLSYTHDGINPDAPSGLSLSNSLTDIDNDSTPEIVVEGVESLATVQLFSDNTCSTSTIASNSKDVLSGQSTVNIEATALAMDGTFTYYALQTDEAGNPSDCSTANVSYEYDGTAPALPSGLSLYDPMTSPSNDSTPEITVAGVESLATVQLFSDASCNTVASNPKDVQQDHVTVTIEANTFVSNGTITYYARQTDEAGNPSGCSIGSFSYEYNGTKPDRPSGLILGINTTSPSDDTTPEIIVQGVEPLATVQLFSDSACSVPASDSKEVLQGETTVNIISNPLTSRGIAVTYYAHQTDGVGNTSFCSNTSLSYTYEATKPAPPLSLSLSNSLTSPGNDSTPEFTVTGVEPLATVELFSDSILQYKLLATSSTRSHRVQSTVNIVANTIAI